MLLHQSGLEQHLHSSAEVNDRVLGGFVELADAALQEIKRIAGERIEDVVLIHQARSAFASNWSRSRLMLVTAQSGSCVKGLVT